MRTSTPKRCKYDELGGICNVPIAGDGDFCENHAEKSQTNKIGCVVVLVIGAILLLGFIALGTCGT